MEDWERDAQDLAIEMRLERLERTALRSEELHCRHCGRRIHYSAADVVFLHKDGLYYCDETPSIMRHADP